MFRSDKKPFAKETSNEPAVKQTPIQSWQPEPPAPHVEKAAPTPSMHVQPPEQPRAIGERDAMARDIKDGVLNGFVGFGTVMAGEAVFKGMLRVDGNLTGQVSSDDGTLLVGSNGQVDAGVNVSIATIHGTVNGDIVATKRIELGRSAKVVGNIQTPALVIEQGAIFEGNCKMVQPSVIADSESKEKERKISRSNVPRANDLGIVSDISDIAS